MGAAVEGHAEQTGVGLAAAADALAGLNDGDLLACGRETASGGNSRRAGADYHDVDMARRRHSGEGRGGGY
jgi:hypothetical protein